jgi:hypothetical protein
MRLVAIIVASSLALGSFAASAATAAPNPAGTGQPGTATPKGVSCPQVITSPNGFNTPGFAQATSVYANPGTTPGNNPHAVAEYDIACYQTSQPH